MTDSGSTSGSVTPGAGSGAGYRRRVALGFGLFAIFFVFYMVTAIIQTPTLRELASIPFAGMPLGLFLSLAIFPVSWILISVYFLLWR